MPIKQDREYRAIALLKPTETNKRIDSEYYVEGYATTFDKPYVIYTAEDGTEYKEMIDSTAFEGADMSDIIFLYNHAGRVMARPKNGTLIVEPRKEGLFIAADLSKSDAARSMYEDIKNGLVDKMSWAFRVQADEYDRLTRTRTIRKIKKVYDVSAVDRPANIDTSISARDYFDGVIEAEKAERLAAEAAVLKRKKLKLKLEVMSLDKN